MREIKVDVAVVGASPAGLSAAESAARTGAKTLLIDRDFASLPNANTVFEGMAEIARIRTDPFSIHKVRGMRLLSPSGHGLEIEANGCFLDRERFYGYYLDLAKNAGTEIEEADVRKVSRTCERVELSLSSGDRISSKIVIDAGGVDSIVALSLGLSPIRYPDDIAWAMEVEVRHPGIGDEDRFEYWLGSIAPGWKATFSPAGGDRATLGVFVRRHGRDVRPFLDAFLRAFVKRRSNLYPGLESMEVLEVRRGGDPIAALPGEIVADNIMVAGGAAAQSGLAYSMRSGAICGDIAGWAALSGDTSREQLFKYVRRWRKELGTQYLLGRASLETLRAMSDGEIDRLVLALKGKDLVLSGGIFKKTANSAVKVTAAMPKLLPRFLINLLGSLTC